ncbi:hypothetical protein WJX84_004262 [Apatococcus fuscideae]|uniref:Protein kinase domain-containing protein n=1 Tax=Apatococcus fuscideae TaxID=2026836 RepID=A0AAW1TJT1_9CHLO
MMVMEYLEGGSLYHSLVCLDPLNPGMGLFSWYKRGSNIAKDIALGLCAIHAKRVIHFDVKSPNVILAAALTAKPQSISWVTDAAPRQTSTHLVLWEIVTDDRATRGQLYDAEVSEQCPAPIWDLIRLQAEPSRRPTAGQIVHRLLEVEASVRQPAQQTQPSCKAAAEPRSGLSRGSAQPPNTAKLAREPGLPEVVDGKASDGSPSLTDVVAFEGPQRRHTPPRIVPPSMAVSPSAHQLSPAGSQRRVQPQGRMCEPSHLEQFISGHASGVSLP